MLTSCHSIPRDSKSFHISMLGLCISNLFFVTDIIISILIRKYIYVFVLKEKIQGSFKRHFFLKKCLQRKKSLKFVFYDCFYSFLLHKAASKNSPLSVKQHSNLTIFFFSLFLQKNLYSFQTSVIFYCHLQ